MYRIHMFDGLILPEYLPSGGSNDIGSGDALTSFNQLPGGGFFDNYGERISPQNIRPITRNCVIWGDTADELYTKFNALRGKIGKRGRLSVRFDNGEIWWQWARLQRVHNPRPIDAKANWLPCGLTFVTAAQQWYGLVETADGWYVGDESFYLGDGSAELGMDGHTFDLDFPTGSLDVALVNEGSTHVRNMRIELQLDENITTVTIVNQTSGSYMQWTNPGIAGGWTLILDTGEKSCRVRHGTTGMALSAIINRGGRVYVHTVDPHGLSTGDSIEIAGTEDFDGEYHNIISTGSSTVYYEKLPESEAQLVEVSTGEVYLLEDSWVNLVVTDRTNWFLLSPGANVITVTTLTDSTPQLQDYTVSFAWYAHFK